MRTPRAIFVVVLVVSGLTAPLWAQQNADSRSAGAAARLTALLDQRQLDAFAARDPERPGHVVAALYFPGTQLLVVSAPYPTAALLDQRLAASEYRDVYVDVQSAAGRDGQFFVMDMLADGLQRACERDQPFDSTSRNGGAHLSFDGNWRSQQLTEKQYNTRFDEDDARYERMLAVLVRALAPATSPPLGTAAAVR